ncbi:uncharacterized protein LOC134017143 [Osmerus eperlanus]|uniref:uncharacterized protein LOC134017143 n=1 Tax=Osmerus eperlanus TaxID=29151 RepID=UPI002E0ED2F8
MSHWTNCSTVSTSLDHRPPLLALDRADHIWQNVKHEVISALCGHKFTAVPHLHDAHLFHPFHLIGKRTERSLLSRKVRNLFPLGPLQDLLDDRKDLYGASLAKEAPERRDFLHEAVLDGLGRVRVQVNHTSKEAAVCLLPPHRQLALRDNLPWLDSVHRLYLVSQAYCSSDIRLRLLGTESRTELRLGPDTPLGFSCLRLSVSPSGLLEVCRGLEDSCPHPRARWARYGSPEYHALTAEKPAAPRLMGLLAQFVFHISGRSATSLPASAITPPGLSSSEVPLDYQEEQEISTQALLPVEEEEGG